MISSSFMRFWFTKFLVFFGLALFAAAIPATPTQVVASGIGNSSGSGPASVLIQWKDNSVGETQWHISYSTDNGASYTIIQPVMASTTRTGTPTVTFLWSGAATNVSYVFRVRAYDGMNGAFSIPSAGITTSSLILTATPTPCEAPNLSWQPVQNATSYKIFYRAPGTSSDAFLGENQFFDTAFQVSSDLLKTGLSYSFLVKPFIGSTEIGSSSRLSFTVNGMTSKTGIAGVPGVAVAHTFTHATSSTVQTRLLTGVPAGLTFSASTGSLTGDCPAVGIYRMNYTVIFSSGCNLTQVFTLRVRPATGAPVVLAAIPGWNAVPGATRNTDLTNLFADPDADSAMRLTTTAGVIDLLLYDGAVPATVTNFKNYASLARYNGVCFHRSVANEILETGGFIGTGTAYSFNRVVADAAIANEFGFENIQGTVAMVKVPGDPNSATSQFAINLTDNRATQDYADGGRSVFGRITSTTLAVATTINVYRRDTQNLLLDGSTTPTSFPNFPLNSSSSTMDQTKLVKINSMAAIPTLSYTVTGNTNPAVASADIVAGELRLVSLTRGTTTITVTATDLENQTRSQSFTVLPVDTFATWAATQSFPPGQNGATQNPDQDGWVNLQEFAFLTNPLLHDVMGQAVVHGSTGVSPDVRFLTVTFPVRKQTQGLTYAVEASTNLVGGWTEIWNSAEGYSGPQVVSALDQVDRTVLRIKDTRAQTAQMQRFLRVRLAEE
jgi:cyclophilin family peptidyl-prolyl cis-trans isomerase